jgi:signal transduction histidine kinase/DNA-binding response OmpR family regulator
MRFYHKIGFRFIVGAVVLVSAGTGVLAWRIQDISKEVLRKQDSADLFDETNLRFREVLADIQTLREDVIGLVNVPSVRQLQWALHYEKGWIKSAPKRFEGKPDEFIEYARKEVDQDFARLLKTRDRYLRVEYYLDRTSPDAPVLALNQGRLSAWKGLPLAKDDLLVKRANRTNLNVSFSNVRFWRDEQGKRLAALQACLPVTFADSDHPPGLLVVTVDVEPWSKALTRSPRHLVFLANGQQRLLMYPRPGHPAAELLEPREADTEQLRDFTRRWLTDNAGLQQDPSFTPTYPVKYRPPAPQASGFDGEEAPELRFLLLRFRVGPPILNDPDKRGELVRALRELQAQHPNLVVGTEISRGNDELLIRGWEDDRQTLRDIRQELTGQFGAGLRPLNQGEPLACSHFVRTLYKFSLGPAEEARGPSDLPEQCLYVAMAAPIETIDARVYDHLLDVLGVMAWCILGGVGLAVLGSVLITRRLNAITEATQELAGGNYDVSLPVQDRTEVGVLARSFAFMAGQIQERQREIARHNEELGQRVKERTGELEAANVELAGLANAKDMFLATVSHELRNPLNHVIGFLQLLEMTQLDENQQRDLGKISHAANLLLALVNDLLDYQKIIQGVLALEPTSFDLAPWIEELADDMRPKVAEKGNELVVDCPADIGTLDADEKRVRQALTNLLSNAAKFTQDGVITVSVRRESAGRGEWVRLDVRDTGRGMTLGQQAELFQPFTRLLSRSENPEGTGLGLALSQKLCRHMDGDLVLSHSEPGQGSTFTIRLPATRVGATAVSAVSPTRTADTAVAPAARPTSVLVIDDDPDVRELMRRHLEEQGFTVHLAASGAEGLEMVKRLRPDAITLDVLMPGIDGWGTLAALQVDAETAHIPVILITILDDRTRGFALGAWEILPKPISWSRLVDLLHHLEPNTGPVLLVDDDPALRELAGRTLRQHGLEVCCAENGREALTAAARRCPSLVLLDLAMPVMDGFEFVEAFRKDPARREVPVVVLTARDLTDDDRRRLNGMVQRILPKGMGTLDELLREVEWLLHNHKASPRPEPDSADAAPAGLADARGG